MGDHVPSGRASAQPAAAHEVQQMGRYRSNGTTQLQPGQVELLLGVFPVPEHQSEG